MGARPAVPRYLQIAETLRQGLRGEGERIPSEHQLCARFRVSRPTIRQALDVLLQEGLLYRRAGRGTFSTPVPGGKRKLRVIGSVDDMIALSDETWFKLVAREVVPLPADVARALRLAPGTMAYRVEGVRHADDGPFQHMSAYVPAAIGAALSEEDLSKTSLIASIERQLGLPINLLEQTIDAVLAPRHVAELLGVRPRMPLLCFERTYYAASGEPVEHVVTHHQARRYPYRLMLARAERRGGDPGASAGTGPPRRPQPPRPS